MFFGMLVWISCERLNRVGTVWYSHVSTPTDISANETRWLQLVFFYVAIVAVYRRRRNLEACTEAAGRSWWKNVQTHIKFLKKANPWGLTKVQKNLGVNDNSLMDSNWLYKNLYPPKGLCEAEPEWGPFWFFPFYCVWEGYLTLLKSPLSGGLFETLKMFYPPEGLCRAEPERGPIVFTLHFVGVGRGTVGFKFSGGERPFWYLENVLSPEGTSACRLL